MTIAYLNGTFVPLEQAQVSAMDRGFLFGDGVYEVIPVYNRHLFRFAEHMRRLRHSLHEIDLAIKETDEALLDIVNEIVKRNESADQGVYLQITRGSTPIRDHIFPVGIHPTIFSYSVSLPSKTIAERSQGVAAITVEDIRWSHCDIKTISLMANILLRHEATKKNCYEAFIVRDGFVLEGSASNFFMVKNNILITPLLSKFTLGGITRDLVLELASNLSFPTEVRNVSVQELSEADEIWTTSSTREITPVLKLNEKTVGTGIAGPVWLQFIKAYQDFKNTFTG